MKKRFLSIITTLTLLGTFAFSSVSTQAATKSETYRLYKKWITQNIDTQYEKFAFAKVDKDNIPELIGFYHDYFSNLECYVILTNVNGEIVEESFCDGVASAGGYRGSYYFIPKQAKVYSSSFSSGMGAGYDEIYAFKNGKMKKIHSGTLDNIFLDDSMGKWDGKTCSNEVYNKVLNKLWDKNHQVDFYSLNYVDKEQLF